MENLNKSKQPLHSVRSKGAVKTHREINSSLNEVLRIHRDGLPHLNLVIQME